ncbi:hypothetical protein LCL95_00755 [Bacillus timonensis]|nr:hypothetical protein [Bacillus timonensis]
MSGEMSAIGMLLDETVKQYYDLADNIQKGNNIEKHKIVINNKVQLITTILKKIDSDLGENKKLWYKELSGSDTATQTYMMEKLNSK